MDKFNGLLIDIVEESLKKSNLTYENWELVICNNIDELKNELNELNNIDPIVFYFNYLETIRITEYFKNKGVRINDTNIRKGSNGIIFKFINQ